MHLHKLFYAEESHFLLLEDRFLESTILCELVLVCLILGFLLVGVLLGKLGTKCCCFLAFIDFY